MVAGARAGAGAARAELGKAAVAAVLAVLVGVFHVLRRGRFLAVLEMRNNSFYYHFSFERAAFSGSAYAARSISAISSYCSSVP